MTESLLKVPRYSILRHVGSGAHADVFQARDRISEKMAALKLLRRDRFGTPEEDILQREYELLLDLQEPALPEVYAFRRNVDLRPVIIMEWIDGESLDQKSEPLPWNETTLNALYSLTSAVSALHRRGWSHLDLKPANIVISSQKREETGRTPLRILDAGLMASTGHSIEPRGTPGYIAPEILKREGWDERADLFSLGGIFYQLLTGRPAFAGPALDEVIDQTLRGAFTPLEICEPSLPPPLCQLVNGLLDPDPKKRPGNGADVINVLERLSVLEGLDPPTIVPNSWQRENALPWPPIPRPETQEIVDSLSSETKALLKILPVTVSSGLGRESFARNLADILSMAGFNASLLMGAQGHFASAKEADTALCAFFSPADLGGISEQRNRKQSLNGFLWNESPILVWDLGTTPPGWLNKWLNDLALELTSISAHSEKGRGTPSLVLLCSHIETPDIPLRTADIQSFSLAPLSPEALRSYTARHLSSEQDIEKIVKQSQGYPEILGGLLEAKRRHQTTITGLSDDKIESPLSILHGLLAARTRILSDSSRRALSMLEMAGIPLTLDLWEELCEGGNLDLRSISIELQNLGLIGCSLKGWETHYADLIDQGRYLIRSPRKEDHIRMASVLKKLQKTDQVEYWKPIIGHLLAGKAAETPRMGLAMAMRLYRMGREDEALHILRRIDADLDQRDLSRHLWTQRLHYRISWEVGPQGRQLETISNLSLKDPIVISLNSRGLSAEGRTQEAWNQLAEYSCDEYPAPLRAFVLCAKALVSYYVMSSRAFCDEALKALESFPPKGMDDLRALLLQRIVQSALWDGDETLATESLEQLKSFKSTSYKNHVIHTIKIATGYYNYHHNNLEEAWKAASQATESARRTGRVDRLTVALSNQANIAAQSGKWEEAVKANREYLAFARTLNHIGKQINALRNLSLNRQIQALYDLAIEMGAEAVDLARKTSDRERKVAVLPVLASALVLVGRRSEAHAAATEALTLLKETDYDFDRAIAFDAAARASLDLKDDDREIEPELMLKAYETFEKAGMSDVAAEVALEMAWEELRLENNAEARIWMDRAADFPRDKVPRVDIWKGLVLARWMSTTDRWDTQEGQMIWSDLKRMMTAARTLGFYELLWRLEYVSAHARLTRGDRPTALNELRQAQRTFNRIVEGLKVPQNRQGYLTRPDQRRFTQLIKTLGL